MPSFFSSLFSLAVSFGDFGETVDSFTLLVVGGDFGDFPAAEDLELVVGDLDGERRDETVVGTFFVNLVSDNSCTIVFSGVVFFDSTDGDFILGFLGVCSSLFFSLSSFFSAGLLPFSLGGCFGLPPSLSWAAAGDTFSSGVLTVLEGGAFIAVVTRGDGVVVVWVEPSEGVMG